MKEFVITKHRTLYTRLEYYDLLRDLSSRLGKELFLFMLSMPISQKKKITDKMAEIEKLKNEVKKTILDGKAREYVSYELNTLINNYTQEINILLGCKR